MMQTGNVDLRDDEDDQQSKNCNFLYFEQVVEEKPSSNLIQEKANQYSNELLADLKMEITAGELPKKDFIKSLYNKSDEDQINQQISNIRKGCILILFKDKETNMKLKKYSNDDSQKRRKHPKKNYYQTKLIRLYKKLLRFYLNDKVQYAKADIYASKKHEIHTNNNKEILSSLCEVKQGIFKKNDINLIFGDQVICKNFEYYVKGLFKKLEINELVKCFGFSCCLTEEHNSICAGLWIKLRDWTISGF